MLRPIKYTSGNGAFFWREIIWRTLTQNTCTFGFFLFYFACTRGKESKNDKRSGTMLLKTLSNVDCKIHHLWRRKCYSIVVQHSRLLKSDRVVNGEQEELEGWAGAKTSTEKFSTPLNLYQYLVEPCTPSFVGSPVCVSSPALWLPSQRHKYVFDTEHCHM